MTIEVWNIVLNAVILVLLTSGGIWLRYVVKQQLNSKDAALQALEGVVKFKDAHIASLEGNTAPAIVAAYAAMREHADQITGDYQNLVTKYNEVTSKTELSIQLIPAQIALSQAHGLNMAADILRKRVVELLFPGDELNPSFKEDEPFIETIYEAVLNAGTEIASESEKSSAIASQLVMPFWKSLSKAEANEIIESLEQLLDEDSASTRENDATPKHD